MSRFRAITPLASAILALFGAGNGNAQSNLLTNPRFEERSQLQTMQVRSCDDMSSAKGWTTWIQAIGCVPESGVELATDLVQAPPTNPSSPSSRLMHVRTRQVNPLGMGDPGRSGIAQTFDSTTALHTRVLASVWVFVVRGTVGMGAGYTGTIRTVVRSSKVGEWEQLITTNSTDPANQMVIFGIDPAGSEFYVADAAVCPADSDEELGACRQMIQVDTSAAALSVKK